MRRTRQSAKNAGQSIVSGRDRMVNAGKAPEQLDACSSYSGDRAALNRKKPVSGTVVAVHKRKAADSDDSDFKAESNDQAV